jgi:hypothetical protein
MLHQNKSQSFPYVTQIRSEHFHLLSGELGFGFHVKSYSTVITGSFSHAVFYGVSVLVLVSVMFRLLHLDLERLKTF